MIVWCLKKNLKLTKNVFRFQKWQHHFRDWFTNISHFTFEISKTNLNKMWENRGLHHWRGWFKIEQLLNSLWSKCIGTGWQLMHILLPAATQFLFETNGKFIKTMGLQSFDNENKNKAEESRANRRWFKIMI